MPGILTENEINEILNEQTVGRIGCYSAGRVYVFPINYAFDGEYLYAHSKEGLKVEIMRKHPEVCFEVDIQDRKGDWKSVMLWGAFEEISAIRSQRAAMKIFTTQMARLIPNMKAMPSHGFVKGDQKSTDPFKSIVFKIKIAEKTGRFEKR